MMTFPRLPFRLSAILLLCILLGGCGYGFTPSGPTVLEPEEGQGAKSIAIGSVENPTLQTWMEPELRNVLRDELASRSSAVWTDTDSADMIMDIVIDRYIISAAVQDKREKTLKFEVALTISAVLKDRKEGTLIWQSGPVRRVEYYLDDNDKAAAEHRVVAMAVRVLVDRMSHSF